MNESPVPVTVLPAEHPRRPELEAALARAGAGGVTVVLDDPGAARIAVMAGARVLVVAALLDRRAVNALLDVGVHGVVGADRPDEVVAQIARVVADGHVVVPAEARQVLRRPVLTTRQKQIAAMLVMGLPNAEIAERLFISEPTVKSHVTQIFSKLDVRSRKEAVDVILDPALGLGAGILGIPEAARVQSAYGTPKVA